MPKTIQLKEATYEQLQGYKVGGLTFDDIIRRLMERLDAGEFQREYREWQKRVVANMRRSGDFREL